MRECAGGDSFSPPPFSYALMGHYVIGALKVVLIAGLLWAVGLTDWAGRIPIIMAILTAGVVMIATETVVAAVERVFVLRYRHPDPGSVGMTVSDALLPISISLIVGMLIASVDGGAVATMLITTVVYWFFLVVVERPWRDGFTQEEVHEKMEETKKMTREFF